MSDRKNVKTGHHPERANAGLKMMDRVVGIPLVYLLGIGKIFKRRPRTVPSSVNRVGILQTAAIGDTVLSSALVQDIKQAYPGCDITFFTGGSNSDAALLIPGIDRVLQLPVKRPLKAIRIIRHAGPFDLWIDCGPWPRLNAVLSACADAAVAVGFKTPGQHRHVAYDLVAKHLSSRHELENYRALLRAAGIRGQSMPVLAVSAAPGKERAIVVHMFPGGSRSYLKVWPADHWRDLIRRFLDDGFDILLTGSAANRGEAEAFRDTLQQKERVRVLAGSATLAETVRYLASAMLVVSVDTGIMHIASAMGCNLVSLHGPTSPRRWGPLNANALTVSLERPCSPCLSLGFESSCQDPQCMIQLGVHEVYGAAQRLLVSQSKRSVQEAG
jgi:ADP-heptose:LPS heptosyltransferase